VCKKKTGDFVSPELPHLCTNINERIIMSKKLENKVAIITGGAQGMGASHAKRFVAEGAKVVITDILEEKGKALAQELGDNALFIKHDVTKAADWDKVVKETEAAFGPVNILINNAGVGFVKLI